MSLMRELWSPRDDERLLRFEGALATGSLAQALFAIEGADGPARRAALLHFEHWGETLSRQCRDQTRAVVWAERMRLLLAKELELGKRRDAQLSPEACHLTATLRRRRGIPHLLSAVWMLVADAAGLSIAGLDFPLYYLVCVGDDDAGRVYCDPFCLGRRLRVSDCRNIVSHLTDGRFEWDDALLRPAPPDALIDGVLRHLLFCYQHQGDTVRHYQTLRLVSALHPDRGDIALASVQLTLKLGALEMAEEQLEHVAQRFPDLDEEIAFLRDAIDDREMTVH